MRKYFCSWCSIWGVMVECSCPGTQNLFMCQYGILEAVHPSLPSTLFVKQTNESMAHTYAHQVMTWIRLSSCSWVTRHTQCSTYQPLCLIYTSDIPCSSNTGVDGLHRSSVERDAMVLTLWWDGVHGWQDSGHVKLVLIHKYLLGYGIYSQHYRSDMHG